MLNKMISFEQHILEQCVVDYILDFSNLLNAISLLNFSFVKVPNPVGYGWKMEDAVSNRLDGCVTSSRGCLGPACV